MFEFSRFSYLRGTITTGMNKAKGISAVDLFKTKTLSIVTCLLGRSARLIQVGFTQNVGRNLGLIQATFFFFFRITNKPMEQKENSNQKICKR